MRKASLYVLLLALTGCTTVPTKPSTPDNPSALPLTGTDISVPVQLTEYHNGNRREFKPGDLFEPVNPDALLVVTFQTPVTGEGAADPAWQGLDQLMKELNTEVAIRKKNLDLVLAVESGQHSRGDEQTKASIALGTQHAVFVAKAKAVMGEQEYTKMKKQAQNTGVNILDLEAEWIKTQREILTKQTASIVQNAASSVTISVVALSKSKAGGAAKALHVENYDNIPVGELTTAPKTQVGLSASDYAQLQAGFQMAANVADQLSQLKSNNAQILDKVRQIGATALDQAVKNLDGIATQMDSWQLLLSTSEASLNALAQDPTAIGQKAKALKTQVDALLAQIESFQTTVSMAKDLKKQLEQKNVDVIAMFTSDVTSVAAFLTRADSLQTSLKDFPKNAVATASAAKDLMSLAVTTDAQNELTQLKTLADGITKNLTSAFDDINKTLSNVSSSLQTATQGANDAKNTVNAAATIGAAQTTAIPHDLNDLPRGTIDLSPANLSPGDRVEIRITADNASLKKTSSISFPLLVRHVGLYRGYSGQLVFAAPGTGPQKNTFETTAAVLATWKIGVEHPSGLTAVWDWINPGLGFHAVILHQAPVTTAETGIGMSMSLWDDLITGGYGWNLGAPRNPPYYFVGIGLLELLQQFKTVRPADTTAK